ncbi:MAG: response regulator [candidate division WS1 bacterium]|nr:response regulator [candidate division WS1 bacterium]
MAKVLVVDDDQSVREVLVQTLQDAGFEADAEAGGRRALTALCRATAQDEPYDAMVLDIIMPGVDGWQVLEAIRSNPLWQDMPVLVISGLVNGAGEVARVSDYDSFFVEKSGNFVDVIKTALGRLVNAA